jgi:asparagine synthase (glutamine-hydrolysing)
MCGINGFNFPDRKLVEKMNEAIRYRGPDGEGIFSDEKISLGHRRLAIIDLSQRGSQPMCDDSGNLVIVFNGEIYNFQEIRKNLGKKYSFKSECDTEVILYAYKEWGEKGVEKFNGMWAFAIYDREKKEIFLSRDRLGIKPLYYFFDGEKFIFSSEITAILKHDIKKELNKSAVSSYLSYRYVLGEETFFKNIYKVLPGYNLLFDIKKKHLKKEEYWDLSPGEEIFSLEKAEKITKEGLLDSVGLRKISDVPLGVTLSGGLDSSLIAGMLAGMQKKAINTFSVRFQEEGFDETPFARVVAKKHKTRHKEVEVNISNLISLMKKYSKFKDSPPGVPNELALFLLSKKIKKTVTVILSGEGADEIFEGYGRIFSSSKDFEILSKIRKHKNANKIYKNEFPSLYRRYKGKFFASEMDHFLFRYNYWTDEEKNSILKKECKKDFRPFFKKYFSKYTLPYQKKISYILLKLHLPGLLNRLDSSTMASSVEGRVPFLDHKFLENAFNIQSGFKTLWYLSEKKLLEKNFSGDEASERENVSKYILKDIAKEFIPIEIIDRKKKGFPLPLNKWFREDLLSVSKKFLLSKKSRIKKVIQQKRLKKWLEHGRNSGDPLFGQKLWMLLSLEIWLREWF